MADTPYEFTGKTVDEAVAEALAKLNVSRSEVAVEVLSKGSRGIFGIGSEPARVRITLEPSGHSVTAEESVSDQASASEAAPASPVETGEPAESAALAAAAVSESAEEQDADQVESPVPAAERTDDEEAEVVGEEASSGSAHAEAALNDEELAEAASEMLAEIVRLMGFQADVVSSWREDTDGDGGSYLLLDIEGEDLGALIGRRGETLASLQYLVRLMVNQRIKQWRNIVVDVEKYKERREAQLNQLALRMAEQVADSGRAMALEPMPPNERRLVHIALRDHPLVYTQSSGEDDRRKVNIVPRDTAGA